MSSWVYRSSLLLWSGLPFGALPLGLAHAQTPELAANDDQEAARRCFREGHEALARADYSAALERFERAYSLWNNPKITLNIATTLRALGRASESANAYSQYLKEARDNSDKRAEVQAILDELSSSLARIRVSSQAVRRAELDGKPLPTSGDMYFADPGSHELTVQSRSHTQRRGVELRAGQEFVIEFEPSPPAPMLVPGPPRRTDSTSSEPSREAVGSVSSSWFALGRVDIDGSGRGAIGALGFSYEMGRHVHAHGGALLGKRQGAWLGVDVSPFLGVVRPTLGVSLPAFAVDGLRPGLGADVGIRLALTSRWQPFARASVVYFPSVPPNYVSTVFVPAAGMEVRL